MSARNPRSLVDVAALFAVVALDLLAWVVIIAAGITIWRWK